MDENMVYIYPTAKELRRVEQLKLPRMVLNSPILRYFPLEGRREFFLQWSQKDNYGGMTHIRGLNGKPARVYPVGERDFFMKPGVYGDFMAVDEQEMTLRTVNNGPGVPIPINDLVTERQDQLLVRRLNRIEWLCWQLAINGHFIVQDVRGVIQHTSAYPVQSYTAPTDWTDYENARPLFDFQNVAAFGRGKGVDFGRRATAFANRATAMNLTMNTNPADFGAKRVGGGNTVTTLEEVNRIYLTNDLPQVEIYDETYDDENGNPVDHIPNGKVVVMGALNNGQTIGNFRFVFNANNLGGEPAPYMRVINKTENQIPPEVEVHDGFNGGPVIYYPGAIVVMDV
jgi:hypothetical protein